MPKYLLSITIFFSCLFSFCHTPKKAFTKNTYISLEETPISPAQNSYRFQVFFDGRYVYHEKTGTKTEGTIDRLANDNLWEMIEQAKLNEYNNSYLTGVEDTPPTTITYVSAKTNKRISFQQKAPEILKKIVVQLKKIKRNAIM